MKNQLKKGAEIVKYFSTFSSKSIYR